MLGKTTSKSAKGQKGAIMVMVTLLFIAVSVTIIFGMITPIIAQIKNVSRADISRSSFYLAEAGVEDAVYRLKNNMNISSTEHLSIDGETTETTIQSDFDGQTVLSTADFSDHVRSIETRIILGEGVSFSYALQVGAGGFDITGGSTIDGNVYANGPITGGGGSDITGAATSAFEDAPEELYINEDPMPAVDFFEFGTTSDSQDIAQSFTVSDSDVSVENVAVYIKRTNWPDDITVRISPNDGGEPKNQSLATADLSANTVQEGDFEWYELELSSPVSLTEGETYWVVLSAGNNSCSQWYCNSYDIAFNEDVSGEEAMIGRYQNGSWNAVSPTGADLYLRLFSGSIASEIVGNGNYVGAIDVGDRAWAKSVRNAYVGGELWCETSTNTNKSCDTSHPNPPPQDFPITGSMVSSWKDDAESGDIHNGDLNVGWAGTTTGPIKVDGDLDVGGGGELNLTGTMWVTGDVTVSGGGKVSLDPSYGSNSGILIVDGNIDISGGGEFSGSGQEGSYPIVITTSVCPNDDSCGGDDAIDITGGAGAVLLIAQNGTLHMNGGSGTKAMSGYQVNISGGGEVVYESGLADLTLVSDPDGGWNVQSWREVE